MNLVGAAIAELQDGATPTADLGDPDTPAGAALRAASGTYTGDRTWTGDHAFEGGVDLTAAAVTGQPVFTPTVAALAADPNAAISAAVTAALNGGRVDSASGDRVGETVITLPPGRFVVTNPGAFMSGTAADGKRTRGLVIQGSGRFTTEVVFTPAAAGWLFDNQDRVSRLTIRDITFTGGNANASFMNSVSNGGPQSQIFERVVWRGTWDRGLYLSGSNMNSELRFLNCKVNGAWTKFLHCADVQAVNHDFVGCDVEIDTGDGLHYAEGGHINIIGGSWIGGMGNSSGSGALVRLGGTAAPNAINRLHVEGVRVEYRSDSYKFLDSTWRGGTITFKSFHDTGYQGALATAPNIIRFRFDLGGDPVSYAPIVTFDDCRLSGKHEYAMSGQNDKQGRHATYRNSIIEFQASPANFIVSTLTGAAVGRTAAVMPVRFERCLPGSAVAPASTTDEVYDGLLNGTVARNAVLRRHTVSIKNGFSTLPDTGGSQTVTLPLNALIISARAVAPAGASSGSNTTWRYTLTTGETTPTTLFAKGGAESGGTQAAGFNLLSEPYFLADTDAKRTLTLTANSTTAASGTRALFLVEYLS